MLSEVVPPSRFQVQLQLRWLLEFASWLLWLFSRFQVISQDRLQQSQLINNNNNNNTTSKSEYITQMYLLMNNSATNPLKLEGLNQILPRLWMDTQAFGRSLLLCSLCFIFVTAKQEDSNFLKAANEHGSQNAQLIPTDWISSRDSDYRTLSFAYLRRESKKTCVEVLLQINSLQPRYERVWESQG